MVQAGNERSPFGLKPHALLGILLITVAEVALIVQHRFPLAREITIWTTPLCWWGYVLLLDALIHRFTNISMLLDRPRDFLLMLLFSIIFWLVFEAYNLHLRNWRYIGLPENCLVAALGMALSFATIMPGMFFTAELLEISGIFRGVRIARLRVSPRLLYRSVLIGLVFLIFPLLVKQAYARYLFALVWMGFVFLLEPLNYASNTESLLRDLERGELHRILSLFVAGLICGFLWEFWNYWAVAKWVYIAPFTRDVRIFEMPLAGFLGFGPFAWEFFSMYSLTRCLGFRKRHDRRPTEG